MKKLLIIFLTLCMLVGCTPPVNSPPSSSDSESLPVQAPTEAPTAAPTEPEPTEFVSNLLHDDQLVAPNKSLYTLNTPDIKALKYFGEISVWGDYLVVTDFMDAENMGELYTGDRKYRVVLIDLRDGHQAASRIFTYPDPPAVQVSGKYLTVTYLPQGTVEYLDHTLKTCTTYQLPVSQDSWNLCFPDNSGENLYHTDDRNRFLQTNPHTGQQQVLLEDCEDFIVHRRNSQGMTIGYLKSDTLQRRTVYLNFRTGRISPTPFAETAIYAECADGLWLIRNPGESDEYLLGRTTDPHLVNPENGYLLLIDGPVPLLSREDSIEGNTFYTLYKEDGSPYASVEIPESLGYASDPVWCQRLQGYMISVSPEEGPASILFWKPVSTQAPPLQITLRSALPVPEPVLPQELYQKAQSLTNQYGVRILIGEQCSTQYNGVNAQRADDPQAVRTGLEALETVLKAYPAGFLEQLVYGQYACVEINLVGTLETLDVPEDANGYTRFNAFVDHLDDRHIMVVDTTRPDLEQTIFHEFSHIIDVKLEFVSQHRDTLYSPDKWLSLNPPDFSYAEGIFVLPDSIYDTKYNSYFVDLYARTYPTEDRARVMEYAMMNISGTFDPQYAAPLREKLAFYSASIRDGFDTAGWPEVTRWEIPLKGYQYKETAPAA